MLKWQIRNGPSKWTIDLSIGEGGSTATAWQADRVRNRIEECNPNGSKMGASKIKNKDKSSFLAILGTLSMFFTLAVLLCWSLLKMDHRPQKFHVLTLVFPEIPAILNPHYIKGNSKLEHPTFHNYIRIGNYTNRINRNQKIICCGKDAKDGQSRHQIFQKHSINLQSIYLTNSVDVWVSSKFIYHL